MIFPEFIGYRIEKVAQTGPGGTWDQYTKNWLAANTRSV